MTLTAANSETERRPCIRNRHPEKVPARSRRRIIHWFLVIVLLDNDRPIMTLHINRSGRRIVVMVMNPMLIVTIGGPPMMPAVVVCQGYAGANNDHESCNCEYFHNIAFHGVLLLPLNLNRLDGTLGSWVYIVCRDVREPGNPRRLTPIPARPIF